MATPRAKIRWSPPTDSATFNPMGSMIATATAFVIISVKRIVTSTMPNAGNQRPPCQKDLHPGFRRNPTKGFGGARTPVRASWHPQNGSRDLIMRSWRGASLQLRQRPHAHRRLQSQASRAPQMRRRPVRLGESSCSAKAWSTGSLAAHRC